MDPLEPDGGFQNAKDFFSNLFGADVEIIRQMHSRDDDRIRKGTRETILNRKPFGTRNSVTPVSIFQASSTAQCNRKCAIS
ncbi:hypothetical protein PROFUN_08956 [Planoprotostelium fungivorum]|uniref:Uncharacterized protein n=1 Tax=Planoprotostelium fungivorum TaxID=1890364 RepID=A0A2P6NIS3_9EUKA|nr:hypothetical protein PROFUN_08956 [Planoprotostelium fungivorum]